MTPDEYAALDATALRDLVVGGEITQEEVYEAATSRYETTHSTINAVVEWHAQSRLPRPTNGPLAGVPFLRKDYGSCEAGGLVEMGSRLAQGVRATRTGELIAKLNSAGATGVGRSAVPELAQHGTTESRLHGITRNPHNIEFSPGGSSGGAAAAVAAGVVPIAHASDGAGSIRIPASACGLVGLKPGRGMVPSETGDWGGITSEFVVTRTVRDAERCLDLLAESPLIERNGQLRIGLVTTHWAGCVQDPHVTRAAQAAGEALEHLGHDVAPLGALLPQEQLMDLWHPLFSRWMLCDALSLSRQTGRPLDHEHLESHTLAVIDRAQQLSVQDVSEAQLSQAELGWLARERAREIDIVVTPTLARPALPVRSPEDLAYRGPVDLDAVAAVEDEVFCYLFGFNVIGWPALSVPFGMGPAGIPLGVQLAARPGWEKVLLGVARDLPGDL